MDTELQALRDRLTALEEENIRLNEELGRLREKDLAGKPPHQNTAKPIPNAAQARAHPSRRGLLRAAAAVAAGGAGLLSVDVLRPGAPARAANNDALILGSVGNTATAPTGLAVTQDYSAGVYGFAVT